MDAEDKLHELIVSDLKELKKDVKSLLALKYQVLSIASVISVIVATLWQFILK